MGRLNALRGARNALRRMGPLLLPPSRALVQEALDLLTPWGVGVPLVRLGADADGGYLLADDLHGIEALLSPGVADTWDFERVVGEQVGIPAYMIDGSVDAPSGLTNLQNFERLWLGTKSGEGVVSLEDWVGSVSTKHSGDLMMQMDIEGAEYRILRSAPLSVLRRFRTVVIEFHGLDWMRFLPALRYRILPALRKMAVDFEVVHVHPNNCCGVFWTFGAPVPTVLEVTYLRRDRVRTEAVRVELPNPLDRDCVAGLPPVLLPPDWPSEAASTATRANL